MKTQTTKKEKPVKTSLKGSRLWGLLWFFVLFLIDQVTKIIADVYLMTHGNTAITLIPGMLEFGPMHYNRGFAFSALAGSVQWLKMTLVFSTVVLMLILAIVYWKTDNKRTLFRLALVFILAGGMANFADRVYYRVWDPASANGGYRDGVRDMLYVKILFDFGFCNFADFFIVGGGIMMVLSLLFFDTYALVPVGKYKKLAVEADKKADEEKSKKLAKKQAKQQAKAQKKAQKQPQAEVEEKQENQA